MREIPAELGFFFFFGMDKFVTMDPANRDGEIILEIC